MRDLTTVFSAFRTEHKLQDEIDRYFDECDASNKPYSMARLAYHLGVSRQTLYNYETKEKYGELIKRARDRIIACLEEKLLEHGTAGQIFLAKNYGYSDRQEILSHNINNNNSNLDDQTAELLKNVLEKLGK